MQLRLYASDLGYNSLVLEKAWYFVHSWIKSPRKILNYLFHLTFFLLCSCCQALEQD